MRFERDSETPESLLDTTTDLPEVVHRTIAGIHTRWAMSRAGRPAMHQAALRLPQGQCCSASQWACTMA